MWNLALLAIFAKSTLAFSSFGELKSNNTGKVIDPKYYKSSRSSLAMKIIGLGCTRSSFLVPDSMIQVVAFSVLGSSFGFGCVEF